MEHGNSKVPKWQLRPKEILQERGLRMSSHQKLPESPVKFPIAGILESRDMGVSCPKDALVGFKGFNRSHHFRVPLIL